MASSMMLPRASKSARCYQAGDNVRFQANSSCRLKLQRYALFSNGSLSLSPSSQEKHQFSIGDNLLHRNVFKSTSKSSNKFMVFAAIPSLQSVEIASTLFTLGTAFVIPFYTVMILAPNAKLTRKLVESSLPYVVLGAVYLYLLVLSWSPETLKLMFASKYWLPELPGITRMFSSTLTVASAWIHLLAVDLYAGRQIYLDGLQNGIETRHSLILCLLFCPVGILSHYVTKAFALAWRKDDKKDKADVAKLLS